MPTRSDSLHLMPINSLIGEGDQLDGEFFLNGSLRIDGSLKGRVRSKAKVIIGENARVYTSIYAKIIIVSGRVDGNLYAAESIHLLHTAKIYGDILSPNLVIQEGVFLQGRVKIIKADEVDFLDSFS